MSKKNVLIIIIASLLALVLLMYYMITKYDNDDNLLETYAYEQDNIMHDMITNMMSIEETDSADKNYINGMIPHHEAAVKMSEIFLKYDNQKNEMTQLAQDIIKTQNAEIEYMKTLLNTVTEKDSQKSLYYTNEYNNSMHSSHSHSNNHNSISKIFANSMIEHHQMAIDMSEIILKYGDNENVKSLAQQITKTQEEEIKKMEKFLQQ